MGLCCPKAGGQNGSKSKKNYKPQVRSKATFMDLKRTYDIGRDILGQGQYGTVYKATNKKNKDNHIAIKAIDKRMLNEKDIELIYSEVETLQIVDHTNIVRYYETYEDQKFLYLCMELCNGGELIEACAKSGTILDENMAADIILQLLKALNHIHKMNLIHRDIKPENIMFDKQNGKVKFIDFGLAQSVEDIDEEDQIAGTPYYVAPEVIDGEYGIACDIWSLGVVIYFLQSGKMPFNGKGPKQLFKNIQNKQLAMPYNFSPQLQDLMKKMLKKDPDERITAAQAIKHPWFNESKKRKGPDMDEAQQKQILRRLKQFNGRSKLKKAAINMMVKQMADDTFKDLQQVFEKFDTDNTGTLDKQELKQALQTMNKTELTDSAISSIMDQIDENGDREIGYTEFLTAAIDPDLLNDQDKLQGLFNQFDTDKSGDISVDEMIQTFSKFGKGISEEDIKLILEEHDTEEQDGLLSFEEFKNMILDDLLKKDNSDGDDDDSDDSFNNGKENYKSYFEDDDNEPQRLK